jgi:hypothetical protein
MRRIISMKNGTVVVCVVAIVGLAVAPARAEEKKPSAPAASSSHEMPPLPKPGPEHDVLKAEEGNWDAVVESWMEPGKPPTTSKGTETNTLLGGLWLVTDFKGDFMGAPFLGHGVMGWDQNKKKYVSTWVDSMSTGPSTGEATYDAGTKTLAGWMEGPDLSGKVMKMKQTCVLKDADTRIFTMSNVGADGKESPAMRITYKRRKP